MAGPFVRMRQPRVMRGIPGGVAVRVAVAQTAVSTGGRVTSTQEDVFAGIAWPATVTGLPPELAISQATTSVCCGCRRRSTLSVKPEAHNSLFFASVRDPPRQVADRNARFAIVGACGVTEIQDATPASPAGAAAAGDAGEPATACHG